MEMTGSLLLPEDVALVPVQELAEQIRAQIVCSEGDFALIRPNSRTPTKIVDAQAAELLALFRVPSTIVDAVIRYSLEHACNPQETLASAYPLLEKLVQQRSLVSPDWTEASTITRSYSSGDPFADFVIVRYIQGFEDTELYEARDAAGLLVALKIARANERADLRRMFEREAAVLQHLDATVTPQLIAFGQWEGCTYLAIEWCHGVTVDVLAKELRSYPGAVRKRRLHALCSAILKAYSHLHTQHVLHSDIHPGNILVTAEGQVKLIDFGYARVSLPDHPYRKAQRAGVSFFFEPEYAQARLHDQSPPLSSMAGEQYGLAALMYRLLTGSDYLNFALQKEEARRQIIEQSPLAFTSCHVEPWPEVEVLLGRALYKDPSARFASISEFATKWDTVSVVEKQAYGLANVDIAPALQLLEAVLERTRVPGKLFASSSPTNPLCSVNNGEAGIAYALYRIASTRQDAGLLARADIWMARALRDRRNEHAFYDTEMQLTSENIETLSVYHMAGGLHCVDALIAHARADVVAQQNAMNAFLAASDRPAENLDLTLGKASTLLGATLLLETRPDTSWVDCQPLRAFGTVTLRAIWDRLDTYQPIGDECEIKYLGVAHGWAGLLYTTLIWCQCAGEAVPEMCLSRLEQLANLAEPIGEGVRWPARLRGPGRAAVQDPIASWCNGSAGFVHMWTQAYRYYNNPAYIALAQRAAYNVWEAEEQVGSLCCGGIGRAYSLLTLYRLTGEQEWLQRARHLGAQAAAILSDTTFLMNSLYKGQIGAAVLAADLTCPERAYMPFFEPAGWPS